MAFRDLTFPKGTVLFPPCSESCLPYPHIESWPRPVISHVAAAATQTAFSAICR